MVNADEDFYKTSKWNQNKTKKCLCLHHWIENCQFIRGCKKNQNVNK